MTVWHLATKDKGNDRYGGNCAIVRTGAWWYDTAAAYANLNGKYLGNTVNTNGGLEWYNYKDNWLSFKFSEMKLRPRQF